MISHPCPVCCRRQEIAAPRATDRVECVHCGAHFHLPREAYRPRPAGPGRPRVARGFFPPPLPS